MPKANLIEFGHHFTIKKSGYLLEKRGEVAHVAGRLRIIIISHHLTGVSSSLSRVTLETSLVLLAGGQGFFSRGSPVLPHLTQLKMSEIILTGRKTQIKKGRGHR